MIMRKSKKKSTMALGILFVMALLPILGLQAQEKEEDVVAKVKDEVITEKQLQEEMQSKSRQFRIMSLDRLPDEEKSRYRKFILHRMIDEIVIMDAADKMKVGIPENEIQEQVDQISQRFPDMQSFNYALSQQGISMEDLKDKIRESLVVQKVVESVTPSSPTITTADIKKFYEDNPERFKREEEVNARHILIQVKEDAKEEEKKEAKEKIEKIRKKIEKGEDFAELAGENSDCPSGKRAGGDLGWFKRGQMVPAFEKTAFSLEKGKLSDVVETKFGYHLIEVLGKHEAGAVPFEEVKEELKAELTDQERGEAFMKWLNKKKEQYVTFTNPEDKEISPPSGKAEGEDK